MEGPRSGEKEEEEEEEEEEDGWYKSFFFPAADGRVKKRRRQISQKNSMSRAESGMMIPSFDAGSFTALGPKLFFVWDKPPLGQKEKKKSRAHVSGGVKVSKQQHKQQQQQQQQRQRRQQLQRKETVRNALKKKKFLEVSHNFPLPE